MLRQPLRTSQRAAQLRALAPWILAQYALMCVLAGAALAAAGGPVEPGIGTLHDLPLPAPADTFPAAMAMAAHGCVAQSAWAAAHGRQLPRHVVMSRGRDAQWVTVPDGWQLARAGWTTQGWCAR